MDDRTAMTSLRTDTILPTASSGADVFVRLGRVKVFPARTIMLFEGEAGDSIYRIESGHGKVYSTSSSGRELVLGTFGPGDLVGAAALDGGTRTASVMTLAPTRCHVMPLADFRASIFASPSLAIGVIADLIGLLRACNAQVKSLALEEVDERVLRILMREADVDGHRRVLHGRPTQQSIADKAACSREMVSRALKKLEALGCIEVHADRIVIDSERPAVS